MNALKGMTFRTKFETKVKIEKWFPRHMNRGLKQIERTLSKVDCIIEVHDSRIPLSGRNSGLIRSLTSVKPHLLIMNKTDLLDIRYKKSIATHLESNGVNKVIFIDSLNPNTKMNGFSQILPTIISLISKSNRFNREDYNAFNLMILGIPNVGKSTIINKLRNTYLGVGGKATTTGAIAGVTKNVLERIKINANPPVYLFDTPGVLEPKLDKGLEVTMKCALCATLSDDVIGDEIMADYLLYWMNKHNHFQYLDFFKLNEPSDNITEVLVKGAINLNHIKEVKLQETGLFAKRPDIEVTAKAFIKAFRSGTLGRVFLDRDLIEFKSIL